MAAIKDNEKIYDEQISPLITKIVEICIEHDLPMLATFQCTHDVFCSTVIGIHEQDPMMEFIGKMLAQQARAGYISGIIEPRGTAKGKAN